MKFSKVPKFNGTLPINLGWRGGFTKFILVGGPFDSAPQSDMWFNVCVRAENVPKTFVSLLLPIKDFSVPGKNARVHSIVEKTLLEAISGRSVFVGCMGGWGRTGLFLSLLAKAAGVQDPIDYVRDYYSHRAVETKAQEEYVTKFDVSELTSLVNRAGWRQRLRYPFG